MSAKEVQELMTLKDWSKAKLASELDLGENIVYRWLTGERSPGGPASVLMTMWLEQARAEAANGKKVRA